MKVTLFDKLGALLLRIGNGSIFKKKRRDGVATFSFLEEVFHLTKQSYPAARCYRCHEEEGVSFHFDIKSKSKEKATKLHVGEARLEKIQFLFLWTEKLV